MGELALRSTIAPMSHAAIDRVREIEAINLLGSQTKLRTEHVLHGGLYARTMAVPQLGPGEACLITGALIKIATLLVSHGDALVYIGDDKPLRLAGYSVIQASAGRKQVFIAQSGFRLTMIFPTSATTVEEAEEEFTDEADMLMSRRA